MRLCASIVSFLGVAIALLSFFYTNWRMKKKEEEAKREKQDEQIKKNRKDVIAFFYEVKLLLKLCKETLEDKTNSKYVPVANLTSSQLQVIMQFSPYIAELNMAFSYKQKVYEKSQEDEHLGIGTINYIELYLTALYIIFHLQEEINEDSRITDNLREKMKVDQKFLDLLNYLKKIQDNDELIKTFIGYEKSTILNAITNKPDNIYNYMDDQNKTI